MKPRGAGDNTRRLIKDCNFCGLTHETSKFKCPAWGKVCSSCKGKNHFKVKCKKVHLVDVESDCDDPDFKWLAAVKSKSDNRVTALMQVNGHDIRFQLDSGADVNTICSKFVKKDQIRPTNETLMMWNKSKVKPLGKVTLRVKNPRTQGEVDGFHSCGQ